MDNSRQTTLTNKSRPSVRVQWSLYSLMYITTCLAVFFGFRQFVFHDTASYESRWLAWVIGPPFLSLVVTLHPVISALRKRKNSLEVFGVAMGVATISGLLGGVALQFEAFFIHDQQLKWKVFKWQHETFLTIHHILLTSAGAGALVGLTLGLVACKLTSK